MRARVTIRWCLSTAMLVLGCGGQVDVDAPDSGTPRDDTSGGCSTCDPVCSAPSTRCPVTRGHTFPYCSDLSHDPANCGECGNECPPGAACVGGVCGAGTPDADPSDAGPEDAGWFDGGSFDGGSFDGGPIDSRVTDATDPWDTGDFTPPTFGGCTSAVFIDSFSVKVSWIAAVDDSTPPSSMRYDVYPAATPHSEDFTGADVVAGVTETVLRPVSSPYYFVCRARDLAGNEDTNLVEVKATYAP